MSEDHVLPERLGRKSFIWNQYERNYVLNRGCWKDDVIFGDHGRFACWTGDRWGDFHGANIGALFSFVVWMKAAVQKPNDFYAIETGSGCHDF